jgi:hypothetical protein
MLVLGGILVGTFSSSAWTRAGQAPTFWCLGSSYALIDSSFEFPAEPGRRSNYLFVPVRHPSWSVSAPLWMEPGLAVRSKPRGPAYLRPGRKGINYKRATPLAVANGGAIVYGVRKAVSAWGESQGSFHFKNDWEGDHLAQTDELSHFMWGYKMTQFLLWSYEWAGFSQKTTRLISVSQTALVLTLVEYPIDAYNPKQGLGLSDLAFDYAGIGLAYWKHRCRRLDDFDVRISWRKNVIFGNQPVFAQTYDQFDNFVYWLTYRTKLFLPQKALCFGLGYGVTHRQDRPTRHLLLGIGLSLSDFVSLFARNLGTHVKFLDLFYPNLNLEFCSITSSDLRENRQLTISAPSRRFG